MNFDILDAQMRQYETQNDVFVASDVFIVARLDGRNFTRLTKEKLDLKKPFDIKMHKAMLETTQHLMTCGFRVAYGYTQSDEISLLLHPDDNSFSRKERKLLSVMAGEGSAKLSLELNAMACFDNRLCLLPDLQTVVDYFRWRAEDAHRNALNAYCYWTLRDANQSPSATAQRLEQLSIEDKIALLQKRNITFQHIPRWQKRGSGLSWTTQIVEGFNPHLQQSESTERRVLKIEDELPESDNYSAFIRTICETAFASFVA